MAGVLLMTGTVLLKWSFIAPYVTDRITKWTMTQLFPFADRNIFTVMFFK